jgi:hypothetical protein
VPGAAPAAVPGKDGMPGKDALPAQGEMPKLPGK